MPRKCEVSANANTRRCILLAVRSYIRQCLVLPQHSFDLRSVDPKTMRLNEKALSNVSYKSARPLIPILNSLNHKYDMR